MVLERVAKSPEGKPRTYLLSGPWGSGKTTSARVFSMALNCKSKDKPCLTCSSCASFGEDGRYLELDSAMVGNVKDIRALRESLVYHALPGYKVVLLDETHLISPEGQGALLEITENPPDKIFFLFASTDKHKIKKTLLSRAFDLEFTTLTDGQMVEAIRRVTEKEGVTLSQQSQSIIVRRAAGHVRDAISLVERYALLGEDDFIKSVVVVDDLLERMVKSAAEGRKEEVLKSIDILAQAPVVSVSQDISLFIKGLMDEVYIKGESVWGFYSETLVKKTLQLYVVFFQVLRKSTSDMASFLTAWANLISQEKEKSSPKTVMEVDRFKRKN